MTEHSKPSQTDYLAGVLQSLLAATLGGVCQPGVSWCWQLSFHSSPPDWLAGTLPNAVSAALVLFTIWFGAGILRNRLHQQKHVTDISRGDRYSIYVAKLGGDNQRGTVRRLLIEGLNKEFGKGSVEIIPAGILISIDQNVSTDYETEKAKAKIRGLSSKVGGDLLVWGDIYEVQEACCLSIRLNPMSFDGDEKNFQYTINGQLSIDRKFFSDIGESLAEAATADVFGPQGIFGDEKCKHLLSAERRLRSLVIARKIKDSWSYTLPEVLTKKPRAVMFHAYGCAYLQIGLENCQSFYFIESIRAFRLALAECSRDEDERGWFSTRYNLAVALTVSCRLPDDSSEYSMIGYDTRELGSKIERLEEALEIYRSSMSEGCGGIAIFHEQTTLRLAETMAILGDLTNEVGALEEAVISFRRVVTRDRVGRAFADELIGFGRALTLLGKAANTDELLHEAVSVLREAASNTVYYRVDPIEQRLTANIRLGEALSILGNKEGSVAYLLEALESYRDAARILRRRPASRYRYVVQIFLARANYDIYKLTAKVEALARSARSYQIAFKQLKYFGRSVRFGDNVSFWRKLYSTLEETSLSATKSKKFRATLKYNRYNSVLEPDNEQDTLRLQLPFYGIATKLWPRH